MDIRLFSSLIAYYDVSMVVTCLTESSDSENEWTNQLQIEMPSVFHQFVDNVTSADLKFGNFHATTMVLCQDPKLSQSSINPDLVGRNVIWLLTGHSESVLPRLPLTLSSNVLVTRELQDGTMELHEHYAIKSKRKVAHFGTWSSSRGLQVVQNKWERRANFSGVDIIATVVPFYRLLVNEPQSTLSGWFGDVINYVQKELNFR